MERTHPPIAPAPRKPQRPKAPRHGRKEPAAQQDLEALLEVLQAAADGDFSVRLPVEADGTFAAVASALNQLISRNEDLTRELVRACKVVGQEGKVQHRASLEGAAGSWAVAIESLNSLINDTVWPATEVSRVISAVAAGDFSRSMDLVHGDQPLRGAFLQIAETVNTLVEKLGEVTREVTRVAREVGAEGKLGAQANVKDALGSWRDVTDSVNMLAGNLTTQVRNIALVTTAVANGDLSQKITIDAKGEILELKNTINVMVDQLRSFAGEVTRVAKEVGTEGKLGGQAQVRGVSGVWKDLTDNVNAMANNLTIQLRDVSKVATAIANGDLTQKVTVDVKGEILQIKDVINKAVDQLNSFAAEVTRVAKEVGTEGKLGGQAKVPGTAGIWKDLTDNVNQMASNLTNQVRGIVKVVTAVAEGDLSQKLVVEAKGEIAALADTINAMTDTLRTFADQVTTVAREVGIEGKLGGQARVPGAAGTWRDLTDNVNVLAGNLTSQVRNIALVTTAVANGDLSKKITVEARGEILELKDTINAMVEQLRTFASEVTRVAREVGTEGKLGGQAAVPGVAGTWKDLTDNVNGMASNLTDQVRGIVRVVTAVATGDLNKKLIVEAKGEIAALADTINNMTDTLKTFAQQVTTVAREVGIEGKLGGQAKVPGAAGTWRDLTDNVNQLAGNLTTQVRAISEVANAVTKGDLTRTIDVEAQGEVLSLKDTINQMIANLRDTTRTNKEQDWLKTNLAKFTGMMQGQRSLDSLGQLLMSELTPTVSAQLGTFFVMEGGKGEPQQLRLLSSYGYTHRKHVATRYGLGEGLVGQSALEKKAIVANDVPDNYVRISSSVGEAPPRNIVVLPIIFENQVKGVIELGSFQVFNPIHITFLEQLMLSVGVVFNLISASRRTEELLQELQRSNTELESRSKELEDKASLLEIKNREIAEASTNLEEKAKQLALVSKYKSEFLANMSHELRTPLNSMLILSELLMENAENNLSPKQLEYVRTVHSAGRDLLALINQILDLSKVEAGRMTIEQRKVPLAELRRYVERHFQPLAQQKGLGFEIKIAAEVPPTLTTDSQRLEQILKNLLSNALKFTDSGKVELNVHRVADRSQLRDPGLRHAGDVIAFDVTDTGIGIPQEKQALIFEAFQQADASTSRTYGGTGLGLTISRELARLLGGEIGLKSQPGKGSTFSLYLPLSDGDLLPPPPPGEAGLFERSHVEAVPLPRTPAFAPSSAPSTGHSVDLAGRRLLVVDDDIRNLFAVTALLEQHGADVTTATSAQESIEALRRKPDIELVLMDIMMPGIDGYDATRRIHAMEEFANLPVVALTAKAMPGDREKCLEAGCIDFVAKPVRSEELLEKLRSVLHLEGASA